MEISTSVCTVIPEDLDDNQLSLCCICGKTFPAISALHRHINAEHGDDGLESPAENNIEPDSSSSSMTAALPSPNPQASMDMDNINSKSLHQCSICQKSFPGRTSLKVHVQSVHNGIKSLNCEICQKRFSTLSYLRLHVATVHEGVKAFRCPLCSKSYTQNHSLKKHLSTAHGAGSSRSGSCSSTGRSSTSARRIAPAKTSSTSSAAKKPGSSSANPEIQMPATAPSDTTSTSSSTFLRSPQSAVMAPSGVDVSGPTVARCNA